VVVIGAIPGEQIIRSLLEMDFAGVYRPSVEE
jgi:hypothetical protein